MPEVVPASGKKLDDVMLAMDVVDTLRHRQDLVEDELNEGERRDGLIARLREIYDAQGISVPDHILAEGVDALAERRFSYEAPKPSFSVWLARLYVAREKWLMPTLTGFAVGLTALIGVQLAIIGPSKAREAHVEQQLSQVLPASLAKAYAELDSVTDDPDAERLATTYLSDGRQAISDRDVEAANAANAALIALAEDVVVSYDVTIVSRPGEFSGIFRVPEDAPTTRNYYLIVEAIDPAGRAREVTVRSEEDQAVGRVTRWGLRVSEATFNAVAADKRDDQIIQNAVIGTKSSGILDPTYTIDVLGGVITEW